MTHAELEAEIGHKVDLRISFLISDGRLFHRDADDWHEYPPYPGPPDPPDGERMAA